MIDGEERRARLDGPVHTWFGLSYANYLVLPRTLMQSMPVDWQERAIAVLDELDEAFGHIEHPDGYQVTPGREATYSDLDEDVMRRLGVSLSEEDGGDRYFGPDGDEHGPYDRLLIPDDTHAVPHYDRGRTFVEPKEPT